MVDVPSVPEGAQLDDYSKLAQTALTGQQQSNLVNAIFTGSDNESSDGDDS